MALAATHHRAFGTASAALPWASLTITCCPSHVWSTCTYLQLHPSSLPCPGTTGTERGSARKVLALTTLHQTPVVALTLPPSPHKTVLTPILGLTDSRQRTKSLHNAPCVGGGIVYMQTVMSLSPQRTTYRTTSFVSTTPEPCLPFFITLISRTVIPTLLLLALDE